MTRRLPLPMWWDDAGVLRHDPETVERGPSSACPAVVEVRSAVESARRLPWKDRRRGDPRGHRYVVLTLRSASDVTSEEAVLLNPGAARWLGNRLIEAAVLAETGEDGVAQVAALAAPDQDGTT